MGTSANTWWIYAVLSAVFAALTTIFAKVGVANVSSNLATAIRTVIILAVAWAIVLFRGEGGGISALSGRTWLFLVLSGLATGLSWVFYFRALQLGRASQVAPIDKASLAFTIILAVVILRETITWKVALGAAMIVCGALLTLA